MNQHHTTVVRSWSAIAMGVFFSGVTAFVLLDDVIRHDAPVTTKHIMTLAVLSGTVYFGHVLWRELRAWRIGTAFGCSVLFLAGTATCVIMSAGRNAEAVGAKALAAESLNAGRDAAQRDRDEARLRYNAALTAEEEECRTGTGEKCKAKRLTAGLRRSDYETAESKLRALPPEQVPNADVRAAAALFARLPFVSMSASSIEALLLLIFPFLQALFCEIGAIVGFSVGLGHARVARVAKEAAVSIEFPEEPKRKLSDAHLVRTALTRAGRPVSNDELAALMGVTKGEASKRVAALNGEVRKLRNGRCLEISLDRKH